MIQSWEMCWFILKTYTYKGLEHDWCLICPVNLDLSHLLTLAPLELMRWCSLSVLQKVVSLLLTSAPGGLKANFLTNLFQMGKHAKRNESAYELESDALLKRAFYKEVPATSPGCWLQNDQKQHHLSFFGMFSDVLPEFSLLHAASFTSRIPLSFWFF